MTATLNGNSINPATSGRPAAHPRRHHDGHPEKSTNCTRRSDTTPSHTVRDPLAAPTSAMPAHYPGAKDLAMDHGQLIWAEVPALRHFPLGVWPNPERSPSFTYGTLAGEPDP